MRCIICGKKTDNERCTVCGFDASKCPELYPTFSKGMGFDEAIWEYRERCWSNHCSIAPAIPLESVHNERIVVNPLNKSIAAMQDNVLGVSSDGTILTAGLDRLEFTEVNSAISVAAGSKHSVCLLSDGKVIARGDNSVGQCNVQHWSGIKSVAAGGFHTVGLRDDGTVVGCGALWADQSFTASWQNELMTWKDIVYIDAGRYHTVGIRADGSAVACGSNGSGECNVYEWKNVLSIAGGYAFSIGLCSDGTIVKTGVPFKNDGFFDNKYTAIAAGTWYAVALKEDGTVAVAGNGVEKENGIQYWKDVISVTAGDGVVFGLRKDGSVLVAGKDISYFRKVKKWRLRIP